MADRRELGSATVYFTDKEYEKTRDDFDLDDYEDSHEYMKEQQKETPGTRYDNVILLPNGWVECVHVGQEDRNNRKHMADTVPRRRIERIAWKKANKVDGKWVYDVTGEMEESDG